MINKKPIPPEEAYYEPVFKNGQAYVQVSWPAVDEDTVLLPVSVAKEMLSLVFTDKQFEADAFTGPRLSKALRGVLN